MKKLLLFASAIVCASIGNAQVFQMDGEAFGLSNEYANVEAGLIWGEAGSATIFNPFTDELRLYDCKCNNYNQVVFDGSDVIMTNKGVQGGMNPKDINYGNPGISLEPPAYGSVVAVKASAEGYLYIVAKLSSNKNYYVFEDGIPIGFTFAMQANSEAFPEGRIKYSAVGEGAHNVITDAKWTNWPEKVILGADAADVRVNGLGVIGFPVHPGCDYLIGAGASKIPWCGVYFTYYPCDVVLRGTDVENPVEDFVLIEGSQDLQARCNVITYTTSDEQVIWPDRSANFGGPSIISNVYQDGKGTITFDGCISTIGSEAFASISTLTSIEIPSSVTEIHSYAFFYCRSLQSIVLPSSINNIENCAFAYCSSLNSITIPSSVNTIGGSAFLGCDNLKRIVVSENVAECRNNDSYGMFEGISNTCTLYVPKGYKTAYQNAPGWSNFQNIVELNSNIITYTTNDGQIITPSNTAEFGANIISNVYQNGKGTITFDGDVLSIRGNAFMGCENLTEMIIPNSVTAIGGYTFSDCTNLSSLRVLSDDIWYEEDPFFNCTSLKSLFVGATPGHTYGKFAWPFQSIYSTCTLYIPEGSKANYQNADWWGQFQNIEEYPEISVAVGGSELRLDSGSRHQKTLSAVAFYTLSKEIIEYADWSTSSSSIFARQDGYHGENFRPYAEVSPERPGEGYVIVKTADGKEGHSGIIKVYGDHEGTWQSNGFSFETKLKDPENYYRVDGPYTLSISGSGMLPNQNSENTNVFNPSPLPLEPCNTACFYDTEVVLGEGITAIGTYYFSGWTMMSKLEMSPNISSIGTGAFHYCSNLKKIEIPSSVKRIGDNAFAECTSLNSMFVSENIAECTGSPFASISNTCTLYVPKGYKTAYQNAPGWREFQNIVEIDNTGDDSQDAIGENTIQGHEYVDLGLPSGLLWATCNIGAERPEQNGEYYAWGETSAKSRYDWNTYQLGSQASNNSISAYGINDGRYTLTSTNDAAAKNWGSQWSIPSKMQFAELLTSCTWRQTTVNGVLCMEGKGPNGNKILFPYAGAMNITDCQHLGSYGTYWTNEVNAEQCYRGKVFFISKLYPKPEMWDNSGLRYIGNSIRPVSKADDGILEGGFCGYGNDLRYTIYDDLSMKVVGSGHYFNSYSEAWQKSQYKKLVKTVSLQEGLSQIGYESFRGNSGLTTITIPESVTYIDSYAFANCSKLTSMYVGKVPPSCYQSTFSGIQSTCTLYVPAGCKSLYQQSTGWKDFKNIVEYVTSDNLATTNNVLYFDNIEALTGEACTLAINMKNGNNLITNLEFVLQLPEGVSVTALSLNDERITDHQVSYNVLSAGKLKVMVTSFNRGTIWDNDGDLVYVELKVASNASAGQFPLTLQDVKMRTQSGNNITSSNYRGTLSLVDNHLGDVNHDRNITVSDAIGAMNLWLSTDMNGLYKKHADMNLDGKINVSDVVRIVEKVINAEQ